MRVRKRLAITLGDRYGVGPELVAQLSATLVPGPDVAAIVIGDRTVWDAGRRVAGSGDVTEIVAVEEADAGWSFLDRPVDLDNGPMGQVSAAAGKEMLSTLEFVAEAARAGAIDGIVYAPLNKQAMRAAGHAAGDELDFFNSHLPGQGLTGEINILNDLWTSRVTSHVPLGKVAQLITRERVIAGIDLLATALQRSGKTHPRLAVAALNPHAGEGGAFGMEEIEILEPAIAEARGEGHAVSGPFPSDTIFPRALDGSFDGVVTMFHDQGQIALKLVGLGQGVTLLAGFPVPIATPGHGTAYDIAGTGKARVDGLAAATKLVIEMMRNR